jgi:hypothetical protein
VPWRSIPDGASRSRRYAASAAFLASATLFACGQTAARVDAAAGGGGSRANGSGGERASTRGGAPPGGSAGAGRACEPFAEEGDCRSASDCPGTSAPDVAYRCQSKRELFDRCGRPLPLLEPRCSSGCSSGDVCMPFGVCGESECRPICVGGGCQSGETCEQNLCVPLPCEVDGALPCPAGFGCEPGGTSDAHHCARKRCDQGYTCVSWQTCAADSGQCTARACVADGDCGVCGYCVTGTCEPVLGTCVRDLPAMPYGCVWPDEELV